MGQRPHPPQRDLGAHGPAGGFWEINTASHIDFPQQGRIIEIADNTDGTLSIFTTILDHAAPAEFDGNLDAPLSLAALSRELSANDWQHIESGTPNDLNTELIVKTPPGYADCHLRRLSFITRDLAPARPRLPPTPRP